jgi:hypothetical protein
MFRRFVFVLPLICALSLSSSASASAAGAEGPAWKLTAVANPTHLKPGDKSGDEAIVITAINVGGGATNGSPVTVSDLLPAGLKAVKIVGDNAYKEAYAEENTAEEAGTLNCTLSPTQPSCTTSETLDPGDTLIVSIEVDVETTTESSELDSASVSGGGAVSASVSEPVAISSTPAGYGVAKSFAVTSTNQAAGHPNETTEFFLNTINNDRGTGEFYASAPQGPPKDVRFDLPPGVVGTTVGVQRCTMAGVSAEAECPRDTMVGTATLMVAEEKNGIHPTFTVPVFNIEPAPGEPVAFAFNALFFPVRLDTSVLSDGEYNVRVTAPDITTGAEDYMTSLTIWGDPAEHYGPGPDEAARLLEITGKIPAKQYNFGGPGIETVTTGNRTYEIPNDERTALLTNPSQCSAPLSTIVETDSWEGLGPGVFADQESSSGMETGCGQLSFRPTVSMLPDTLEAGAPAGYDFNLHVPQNTDPDSLATPDVKRVSVTLPQGTVISPSAADGLSACSDEQFALHSGMAGNCPRDSQVGTVRVKSPALEERLQGQVYLATPECEPCTAQDAADGSMVRLFVQFVSEGEDGIIVKLEGRGQINQQTGQITTVFENTPQLPFSEFQLILQGGERATLANSRTCGPQTTTADLRPWSTPYTPDATPTDTFDVDENCFGPQFNPSFSAGSTSNQAGDYSSFTLSFGRSDSDEFLNGLQLHMPPGFLGMLSKVSLCEEPQAAQGTCAPGSLIGETTVETGPGADPFVVTGGKVYITGPYKGAPYGLTIVVPAKAGPYTLAGTTGRGTVVVRSAINVNPETSALTVTADPLPTELDGIPLQLRLVNVTINRPEFTFNPSNCSKLAITGTLTSTEAASTNVASSFQVTNCGALKFKPTFKVSTSGSTSRKDGASLDAKLTYPAGAQVNEANVAKFKVDLPKQLPSRLTTLQKACPAAVFAANPASCPPGSVIGIAKVSTPVLTGALTGPVYFVSHGGEQFPNIVIVLQGDGVRVDLVGDTFINKAGITSTTLNTIPDVPFNNFELYLPEGSDSALAANGNLCTSNLQMPTAMVAQNGLEIHQSTKITVTGCPKAKTATKKAKKADKARKSSHDTGRKS